MVEMKRFMVLFYQTFESLFRILFFSKLKKEFKKGNFAKSIFILGNGPSLTSGISEWVNEIGNSDCVGVNLFVETEMYDKIRPAYYIINAPEHYMESDMDPEYFIMQKKIFESLGNKTGWDLELFIPWAAKKYTKWKKYLGENQKIKINYFNHTPVEGFSFFRHWVFSRNFGMPRPHNVLVPSIMLMILKGYSHIRLLGADHSWILNISVDDDNTVLINQKHFYDTAISKPEPMKKLGRGRRKLHEVLLKFMRSFEAYFFIDEFAKSENVKVTNCTRGSFIDAFEREFPDKNNSNGLG